MKKTCQICGVEFDTSHVQQECCGKKCAYILRSTRYAGKGNPKWKGGYLDKACIVCGTKFQCSDGRARYCPEHRVGAHIGEKNCNWNGGKLSVTLRCACCGKEFDVTQTQVRAGRKFCSHACSNIMKNRCSRKQGTSIERAVEGYLTKHGIEFHKQVPLHGITLADFLVGTTVVQCDGVYWHSLSGRQAQDKLQDDRLNQLGYTVLRISDKEISNMDVGRLLTMKAMVATLHSQYQVGWR